MQLYLALCLSLLSGICFNQHTHTRSYVISFFYACAVHTNRPIEHRFNNNRKKKSEREKTGERKSDTDFRYSYIINLRRIPYVFLHNLLVWFLSQTHPPIFFSFFFVCRSHRFIFSLCVLCEMKSVDVYARESCVSGIETSHLQVSSRLKTEIHTIFRKV